MSVLCAARVLSTLETLVPVSVFCVYVSPLQRRCSVNVAGCLNEFYTSYTEVSLLCSSMKVRGKRKSGEEGRC